MNSNPYDLAGRVAIVTGGGTGIGAATARLLARHGADVVIASRTAEELERTAAAIRGATGRRCLAVPTDVKDEEQVVRMVQRTSTNSAVSTSSSTTLAERAWARSPASATRAWDASFGLNVRSAYFCTREAGRHLVAQRSGRDRQRLLRRRSQRRQGRSALRLGEGGAADVHDGHGGRVGALWHPSQLRRGRAGRFGARRRSLASREARHGRRDRECPARPRRARPTRSPTRSTSWPATLRPTSAARRSRSTADLIWAAFRIPNQRLTKFEVESILPQHDGVNGNPISMADTFIVPSIPCCRLAVVAAGCSDNRQQSCTDQPV